MESCYNTESAYKIKFLKCYINNKIIEWNARYRLFNLCHHFAVLYEAAVNISRQTDLYLA